jgi:hypothetical protein
VTYHVLVAMELATCRVQIAGITPHPTVAFIQQYAWQVTDPCDGFLVGKRYLLHDKDTKFIHIFESLLKASGVWVSSGYVSCFPPGAHARVPQSMFGSNGADRIAMSSPYGPHRL